MEIKYLFIFFFFISTQTFSQKEILVGGKKIQMELVDSNKFDIKGVWKIVDQKYFYDDGEISDNKWDSLDKGNPVFISDSMIYACTHTLFSNFAANPFFKYDYFYSFSEGGDFFNQFSDSVLHIAIWAKGDWEKFGKNIDPVSTYDAYVLNNNYIVISSNNSFRYLERITKPTGDEGWKKINDYTAIYLNDFIDDIRLLVPNLKMNRDKFIEYIFFPKFKCNDPKLVLKNLSYDELKKNSEPRSVLYKNLNLTNKTLKGYLSIDKLQSDVFTINQGSEFCKGSYAKFLWRIVSDTTTLSKTIQIEKSTIYTSPNIPTKMYLVKFDEVEVIAEKDNWLHIKYYGKKIVEGWIRKKDTEFH